ncbi:MAG: ATP-dependent zinc metalloprotease FtsH [Desulfovibrionales bacterium]
MKKERQKTGRGPGGSLWPFLLLLLGIWLVFSIFSGPRGTRIPYSEFLEQVKNGNVQQVTIQGNRVNGELEDPAERTVREQTTEYRQFIAYVPPIGDPDLLSQLEQNNVLIDVEPESDFNWVLLLFLFAPFLLLFGIGYMQFKRMGGGQGGIFSMGKSKAKLYDKSKVRTTFDDVAGAEGAKTELREIVSFLKHPERIHRLGGDVPKGVLLVGPPGTGKTLLARAVAGEAEVPFYSITGSDFMEMFVGVGASRVRNLFNDAKKDAPSIIFIDELDAIGRRRGAGLGGGHDEREQTLNQLLSELDGFEPNENVIVMSATNRPDVLDPALLRPGRFDRRITVEMPNTKHRLQILKIYARNKPLAEDVDLERIAKGTPGFSGADLENLLNEATLLAARKDRDQILPEDIEQARDKILMGLQRKGLVLTDMEKKMIAYHEAGHSLVAATLPLADPVHKVSIIPRSRSMGVTQQLPEKEKYIYRKEYMLDRLAVMMGGRAAEELKFETSTSGAGNDLIQATKLARRMVLEWGMSEKFRHMALGGETQEVFLGEQLSKQRNYSETTFREIDKEVKSILEEAYGRAASTLREKESVLDEVAELLLEEEEIPGEEVLKRVGGTKELKAEPHPEIVNAREKS